MDDAEIVPDKIWPRYAALKIAAECCGIGTPAASVVADAAVFAAYLTAGTVPAEATTTAPDPGESLIMFLRLVRDGRVTTKPNGQVVDYDNPRPNFTYTALAGAAEQAGLIEFNDGSRWWWLTPRGVEAAERGAL